MPDDRRVDDPAIIGSIPPAEGAAPPEQPVEAPPRRGRRRPLGYACLLGALGALVGALLAVLWGMGLLGGRDRATETPPENPPPAETTPAAGEWTERMVFSPTPERPETTPEIITAESPVIYCFYEHSRLPADAVLKAQWWHEGKSLGTLELRDHQRGPQPVAAAAPEPGAEAPETAPAAEAEPPPAPTHAVGRFSIQPPPAAEGAPAGFPSGVYEVELSAVGREDIAWRASFMALPRAAKILEGGGPPDAPLLITDLQVAPEAREDGRPINPTTSFGADIRLIHACFRYKGMAPGGSLTVRWHFGYLELPALREELAISTSEGWGTAWMERSGPEPFPPGEYRVTVHLGADERPLAALGFTIAEAPTPAPPQSGP